MNLATFMDTAKIGNSYPEVKILRMIQNGHELALLHRCTTHRWSESGKWDIARMQGPTSYFAMSSFRLS